MQQLNGAKLHGHAIRTSYSKYTYVEMPREEVCVCITVLFVRRESHYGENDGDGDVTFRRSHFTFRTVTVVVSLT